MRIDPRQFHRSSNVLRRSPRILRRASSRIVPSVTTVTLGRSDADLVVTEYGVADLRRISLAERARRMIAIAAPEHREALQGLA